MKNYKLGISILCTLFSLAIPAMASEKLPKPFEVGPLLEFHAYSEEYFMYAETPLTIRDDVLAPAQPRILEIGSGQGHFVQELLLTARIEKAKQVGFVSVEFNEASRKKLAELFARFKAAPHNHDCLLSQAPNITDYIRRNPDKKKEFFTSIVSFYTLHCLCPSDLIEVLKACHSFLQLNGTLWLTLQNTAAFAHQSELQEALELGIKNNDLFPGFNIDEKYTCNRLTYFLNQQLDYPLSIGSGDRSKYLDPYTLSHDFCPLLTTLHDPKWTRALLENFGFDVETCEFTMDEYPARPLKAGELSNNNFQTGYVLVKAKKGKKVPDSKAIDLYVAVAKEKEKRIFELYQQMIKLREGFKDVQIEG